MSERKKIGPRVDAEVWDEWKEHCKEKNGKEKTAGEELTRLMRKDLDQDSVDQHREEMERKMDTVNAKLDYLMGQE